MASNIPILQIGHHLIVPIQGDLHDQSVLELQSDILQRIEKTGAGGLILDSARWTSWTPSWRGCSTTSPPWPG